MLDPQLSAAFAIHSSPGVYAVLLGSGVSRSAAIPTGWEIVLDLITRLAALKGESCKPDPEIWYHSAFGKDPTYGDLLEMLAKTPTERQLLLRSYFDPSEADDDIKTKQPTPAHHAIASLVKSGHIRVVVTTNFDRLMEQALEAVGVSPAVISTGNAVEGALPLTHTKCLVLKLHGDYLDTRIRNTPKELANYDQRLQGLLDRVLDEFGMVICGWSADWDEALRAAFERCKSRRFTTYWIKRGVLSDAAERLIALRAATVIPVPDADEFFTCLQERVQVLANLDAPHPLSTGMAVALMKRFLAEGRYRIRLHDLVTEEVERVVNATTDTEMPVSGSVPYTPHEVQARMTRYESVTNALLHMIATGCVWGEGQHNLLWRSALERLARHQPTGGTVKWLELRAYPAALVFYTGGIAAIARGQMGALRALWDARVCTYHSGGPSPAFQQLYAQAIMDQETGQKFLQNSGGKPTPFHDHLFDVLREPLRAVLPSDHDYDLAFDRFEYMLALTFIELKSSWLPIGRFGWKGLYDDGPEVFAEVAQEVETQGDKWPPIAAGFFPSVEAFEARAKQVAEASGRRGW